MRVLLTGATGYVGAFVLPALLAAGHQPRVLVRSPDRLATKAAALGVELAALEVVVGDMTDAGAVARAAEGVDAAIHAAAEVGVLDPAAAERALLANVAGTRTVLETSLAAGADPVVHVSSVIAVFDPAVHVLTADLPPATRARSPYTRGKALCEELARELQSRGEPVVTVYPGGVTGPGVAGSYGEVASGFASMLRTGALVVRQGGITVLDVRDLAAVLVAALRPGEGPRRYMAGGTLRTLPEIGAVIRALTGRRFPVLPVPGAALRGIGRASDVARALVPYRTVFTGEAMDALTLVRPTDDSAVHAELGVRYRPPEQSIEASLRALHEGGVLRARHVGRLAG